MKPSRRSFLAAILCAPALRWMRFEPEEPRTEWYTGATWVDDNQRVYRLVHAQHAIHPGEIYVKDGYPLGVALYPIAKDDQGWVMVQGACHVLTA